MWWSIIQYTGYDIISWLRNGPSFSLFQLLEVQEVLSQPRESPWISPSLPLITLLHWPLLDNGPIMYLLLVLFWVVCVQLGSFKHDLASHVSSSEWSCHLYAFSLVWPLFRHGLALRWLPKDHNQNSWRRIKGIGDLFTDPLCEVQSNHIMNVLY